MKLRRIMAGILAATMAVTFVACSSSSSSSSSTTSSTSSEESEEEEEEEAERELVDNTYIGEGLPLVEEEEVYTIFYEANSLDYSGDQNTKLINEILSDGTNITIEWEVHIDDYDTQMNLQLAAGVGMPDAYMGSTEESTLLLNTSRFWAISDEDLETYGYSIYSDVLEYCPNGLDDIKKSDGVIWSLPTGDWSSAGNTIGSVLWINTGWIEDLGMEMPSTIEELYDVLVAFRDDDPNGNGENDEIPVLLNSNTLWCLCGSWGLTFQSLSAQNEYIKVVDGEAVAAFQTQNFYDWISTMSDWYAEGLIYAEMFTYDSATMNSLEGQEVQGIYQTWQITEERSEYFEALPVLTVEGYEGEELHSGNADILTANLTGFCITSTCENPTGLLSWWNYAHSSTEMKRISMYGEEGVQWETNDDGTATLISIATEDLPDGIESETSLTYTSGWGGARSAVMFGDDNPVADSSATYGAGHRLSLIEMYEDYLYDEFLPTTSPLAEDVEAIALTKTEIETYVAEFIAQSVVLGIDETSWEEFNTELEKLGVEEYLAYYQKWLDDNAE